MTTRCSDNERLGRISCGQRYGGEMQHCVAKVPWSKYPDGIAHVTSSLSNIDLMWRKGNGHHPAAPWDVGLVQDERGVWHKPMSDAARKSLGIAVPGTHRIDATPSDGVR